MTLPSIIVLTKKHCTMIQRLVLLPLYGAMTTASIRKQHWEIVLHVLLWDSPLTGSDAGTVSGVELVYVKTLMIIVVIVILPNTLACASPIQKGLATSMII